MSSPLKQGRFNFPGYVVNLALVELPMNTQIP